MHSPVENLDVVFVVLTEVICPAPSQPLNTLFTKEAHCVDGFNYTSMCRYPCKEGFDRDNGIQSITCQKNGMWYPPMAANCKGGFFILVHIPVPYFTM